MTDEELYDKFLNDSLSPEELVEFESRLTDEEFGRNLVSYTVEIRDFVHIADKIEPLKKKPIKKFNKTNDVSVYRRKATAVLIPLLGIAALLAVSVWYFNRLPNAAEVTALVDSGKISFTSGKDLDSNNIPLNQSLTSEVKSSIIFKDGTSVSIEAGSVFVLTSVNPKTLKLNSGELGANVAKQYSGKFSITTSDVICSALGTKFSVIKTDEENTSLLVQEGKVSISNDKYESIVSAGEAAVADRNSEIISGSAKTLSKLKWSRWKSGFVKDETVRLYVNFENGLENLASNKPEWTLKQLNGGTFTEGRFPGKKALNDGIVELQGSTSYHPPNFTVFTWANPTKIGLHSPIITQGDVFWRIQLKKESFTYHVGYGKRNFFEGQPLAPGKWHFLTATFDGTKAEVYLNGAWVGEVERDIRNPNFPIYIGGNAQMPDRIFFGKIGEVGIIERVLTEKEIKHIYEQSKP